MKIRRKKAATLTSNWNITLSDRDMKKWGVKYGYDEHDLTFTVDLNMPEEVYAGYIGYGEYGSESANKWGVKYISNVTEIGGEEPFAVEYKVVARVLNGEEITYTEGREPVYIFRASTRESCRTTKRNFVKNLMRDGLLALWEDVDVYVDRWEQANVPVSLVMEVPENGTWRQVSYGEDNQNKAIEFLGSVNFAFRNPKIFRNGELVWEPTSEEVESWGTSSKE